jgi:hypothetical protein
MARREWWVGRVGLKPRLLSLILIAGLVVESCTSHESPLAKCEKKFAYYTGADPDAVVNACVRIEQQN